MNKEPPESTQLDFFKAEPKEPTSPKPISASKAALSRPQGYDEYIHSKQWKNIRIDMFKLRRKLCERCKSTDGISVHHKHYRTFRNEKPCDLEVLCAYHHAIADKEREQETYEGRLERGQETFIQKAYGGYDASIHRQGHHEWLEEKDEDELHDSLGLG